MRKSLMLLVQLALLFSMYSCERNNPPDDLADSIILLYTNDEHGWMEPNLETDGAAGMLGLWMSREGYDGSDKYLILSGGDMWTGPAISTWYSGESMVEVMNAMGYDAAALGNHEVDFKIDGLIARSEQMDFPILCANVKNRSDGEIPQFASPYLIQEIGELKVGIIGLANTVTPYITFAFVNEEFEFTSYSSAIEEYVPILKSEGVDIIILIGHLCNDELFALVPLAKTHNISIIGGGHCHSSLAQMVDSVLLIKGGGHMSGYAKVEFKYISNTGNIEIISYELVENKDSEPDQAVQTIVETWQAEIAEALSEEIAYCSDIINNGSPEMANLVTDSWLYVFPDADVSITNGGGIRQDIPAGIITKNTIVGLLPFDNEILELNLTGTELLDCIASFLLGGMTTIDGYKLADGSPINGESTYTVLTTDYLYSLTATNFSLYDETPVYTSLNYRDPLIDYLKSLNTSPSDPVENYLDYTPRR